MFMRGYLYFYLLDFTIRLENIFFLETSTMRAHCSRILIIYFLLNES